MEIVQKSNRVGFYFKFPSDQYGIRQNAKRAVFVLYFQEKFEARHILSKKRPKRKAPQRRSAQAKNSVGDGLMLRRRLRCSPKGNVRTARLSTNHHHRYVPWPKTNERQQQRDHDLRKEVVSERSENDSSMALSGQCQPARPSAAFCKRYECGGEGIRLYTMPLVLFTSNGGPIDGAIRFVKLRAWQVFDPRTTPAQRPLMLEDDAAVHECGHQSSCRGFGFNKTDRSTGRRSNHPSKVTSGRGKQLP
jgi:hypothetical protein